MRAVDSIRQRARSARPDARQRSERLVGHDAAGSLARQLGGSRITINLHPDRVDRFGRTVAQGLLADGRVRSQSETGISNGGRFPATGRRSAWERALFGPAHPNDEPVVYGALDITADPHGGSPRFGSSFLVLRSTVRIRTTVCVGDSHTGPLDVGTFDEPDSVVAGWCEWVARDGFERGLAIADLASGRLPLAEDRPARSLDAYLEAQIHGGVELADVEAIALDPSFRETDVAETLARAADLHRIDLTFHGGSELAVVDTPVDFRGSTMPAAARVAARADGVVDAASIGRVMASVAWEPPSPEGDADEHPRQRFKQLWHCVERFGHAARGPADPTGLRVGGAPL